MKNADDEKTTASYTMDFIQVGWDFQDKIRKAVEDRTNAFYLCGINWEENRPAILFRHGNGDLDVPRLFNNRSIFGGGFAYLTTLEKAYEQAVLVVKHILLEVSECSNATPEDFRREIAVALRRLDGIGKNADRMRKEMICARDYTLFRDGKKPSFNCTGCEENCPLYGWRAFDKEATK